MAYEKLRRGRRRRGRKKEMEGRQRGNRIEIAKEDDGQGRNNEITTEKEK